MKNDVFIQEVEKIRKEEQSIMEKDIPAIEKDKLSFFYNPKNELHKKSWKKYYQLNFDINYIGLPEKIYRSQYALISPNGDYFSTTFGGHSTKAVSIIASNIALLNEFIDYLIDSKILSENDRNKAKDDIYYYGNVMSGINTALDFLMEKKKWCKISYGTNGNPETVIFDEIRGLTKEQEKTYFISRMFLKGDVVYE